MARRAEPVPVEPCWAHRIGAGDPSMSDVPTYPEYQGLLELARESVRLDHGFVDPVKLRMLERMPVGTDWRISVVGHSGQRTLMDLHMLLLARGQDINPPLPQWLAEIRAEQAAAEAAREEARL